MAGPRDPYIDRRIAERFRVIDRLGAGGHAVVYRAFDEEEARPVALKILREELRLAQSPEAQSAVGRFRREIKLLDRLDDSRHTPNLIASETEAAPYFIAMELIEGPSLLEILNRGEECLPPAGFMLLASEIALGLLDVHTHRIIHRDLAPANIIVSNDQGVPCVLFLDFGIGKTLEAEIDPVTRQATIAGTPQYLSPEQTRGLNIEESSDIYSLGALYYEMLTGRPPIRIRSLAEVARIRREIPTPLRDFRRARWLPDDVNELVTACLGKTAEERPALKEIVSLFGAYRQLPEWSMVGMQIFAPPPASKDKLQGELREGDHIGPYELEECLRMRSRRQTWLARNRSDKQQRALTIFDGDDPQRLQRQEEGLAAAALPEILGIRPLLESRVIEGRVTWISPWVEGETLSDILQDEGPMTPGRVLRLAIQLLELLQAFEAARNDVPFGPIDPSHIILDGFDGLSVLNAGRPLDLGPSGAAAANQDEVPFLAPETLVGGRQGLESDIYSFAAVIWTTLAGHSPWSGLREAQSWQKRNQSVPVLPSPYDSEKAKKLHRFFERALDPDPRLRPAPLPNIVTTLHEALSPLVD